MLEKLFISLDNDSKILYCSKVIIEQIEQLKESLTTQIIEPVHLFHRIYNNEYSKTIIIEKDFIHEIIIRESKIFTRFFPLTKILRVIVRTNSNDDTMLDTKYIDNGNGKRSKVIEGRRNLREESDMKIRQSNYLIIYFNHEQTIECYSEKDDFAEFLTLGNILRNQIRKNQRSL